jgi:hypothetical protein
VTTGSAQRVIIHVGTPKSGTTYLQDLMESSRAALLEGGVLYPGEHAADHFRAAVDLKNDGYLDQEDPAVPGAWARLVEAARAHAGTTVITQELLGDRSAEDVARAMADLDFAEVHVVATARDLGRQLPAAWQEDLKNRHYVTFPDWLDAVRPGSDRDEWYTRAFWLRQDVPNVLRRWQGDLPAERVHVVTVPRRGGDPTELWTRFATVLGIAPGFGRPAGPPNKSLGWVEAEFIRRLNERADYSIEWPLYASRITGHIAGEFLPERPGAVPLSLPAAERSWVSARADVLIAELAQSGYHVVGDLEELRVDATGGPEAVPTFTDSELLDAALDAMVAVLKLKSPAPPAATSEPDPIAEPPAPMPQRRPSPGAPANAGSAPEEVPVVDGPPAVVVGTDACGSLAGVQGPASGDPEPRRGLWRRPRQPR